MRTYTVCFGSCRFRYYTLYHAEQFMRTLRFNGTNCTLTEG